MKAVVAAFNQEKALVGAFSVLTNLRMELFKALIHSVTLSRSCSDNEHPNFHKGQVGRLCAGQAQAASWASDLL